MPKKDIVPHEPLHTTPKFGEEPTHEFVEQLTNLEVKIFYAPSKEDFRHMLSVFMMNTWNDKLQYHGFAEDDVDKMIFELFNGDILPTGMELPQICWGVEGMDMIDTTHLIRHRLFSFSAQAHGDRDMRHDRVMVKPGIIANEEFYERYRKICIEAKQLYVDMMDSGLVNGLDARTIMPRCYEHFYMVRSCIKDIINYCRMRGDEQIQTTADNIIAMKLWLEVLKRYPFLKGLVDFRAQDRFYVQQCSKGKTNIFPPNEKNDVFDWCSSQFFHDKPRDEFPGGFIYKTLREDLLRQIDAIEAE
jgi:thymidylate synthase (FAD)